jgi:hypothetical protein
MAAVAAQVNLHGVGGAGNRTDARTDLAEVHLRVTVQGESTRNVLEQALGNHLHGTSGQLLLGRLEEDTDATAQRGLLVELV